MSDLACFVAATIRDKVVVDLMEELQLLRRKVQQERRDAKTVAITGPMGEPVYAEAAFDSGFYDHSPELWKVEFAQTSSDGGNAFGAAGNVSSGVNPGTTGNRPIHHTAGMMAPTVVTPPRNHAHLHRNRLPANTTSTPRPAATADAMTATAMAMDTPPRLPPAGRSAAAAFDTTAAFQHGSARPRITQCTLRDLHSMEIRIGGICKARFNCGGTVEAFVNDINNNYHQASKSGTVSVWFGGSSGIWLNITLQGIERHRYAALRDYDLSGNHLLQTLEEFWRPTAIVTFQEVAFLISSINGAMQRFGIPAEPPEDDGNESGANMHTEDNQLWI